MLINATDRFSLKLERWSSGEVESGLGRSLGLSLDADNHRAEAAQEDEAAFDADTNGNIR